MKTETELSEGTSGNAGPLVLDVRDLSKTYPGQVALNHASLQVRPGEVHALVGQNGSGKSTLIKLLGGYVKADHGGHVRLLGQQVDLWSPPLEQRQLIRIVHQDLGLVPTLSTVENLGLGRGFAKGFAGRLLWRREVRRAQELLLRFGLAPDVRQPVGQLSAAERAAVAIVRALQDWDVGTTGLLVLDEPTASLNRGEVQALFREVRRVAELGVGVLFVSHALDEVLELADRVTVLRDGNVVAAGIDASTLDPSALVELIVGRKASDLYPTTRPEVGKELLEAEMIYGITLRGLTFKLYTGEVLGFAGLVGSGREEVASSLFGATPRFAGKVLLNKKKVFASPRDSVKAGLALVPADRKSAGLDPQERLVEHVPLPRLGTAQGRFRIRHRQLRRDVAQWVEQLDVQPPLLGRRMEKFSGGNQQKAVLARWLRTEPKVLLLDEPTQGVDVGAKAAIYQQITDAASRGLGVVIASSDAEELVHLCHRVLIMRSGAVAAELTGPTLTEERLVAETLGATSHRKNMRTNLDPITFTVIRDSRDAITVTPSDGSDIPRRATVNPSRGGKFAQWVRRTSDRLRGKS
jgi:ribose transport system ATP-binding protein